MNASYYHEVHRNPMFWFGSVKAREYVMADLVAALRDGNGRNIRMSPPLEEALKTRADYGRVVQQDRTMLF